LISLSRVGRVAWKWIRPIGGAPGWLGKIQSWLPLAVVLVGAPAVTALRSEIDDSIPQGYALVIVLLLGTAGLGFIASYRQQEELDLGADAIQQAIRALHEHSVNVKKRQFTSARVFIGTAPELILRELAESEIMHKMAPLLNLRSALDVPVMDFLQEWDLLGLTKWRQVSPEDPGPSVFGSIRTGPYNLYSLTPLGKQVLQSLKGTARQY